MRTGSQYVSALRDGRRVFVDGQTVDDVTTHPAFAPVVRSVAELYDVAASNPAMQCVDATSGRTVNVVYTLPTTADELRRRREAIEVWARHSHGWLGRSPDHVASFVAAFAAHPEVFDKQGSHDFAGNVGSFHRRMVDESLYVSYAIIPPQVSRATTASGWDSEYLQAGVVEETAQGLVIRGAQMLATGAAVADEVLVSCIKPLTPDDSDFAVSFVVAPDTEGLKLYCRRPYIPGSTSEFDYPLTNHYDEPDALLVFDDVLVPWDRVFIDRDVNAVRRQFFDTGAHVLGNWQAQIRFATKCKFIAGVAARATQINGVDKFPGVQEKLGDMASLASGVRSAVLAAEYLAGSDSAGAWLPDRPTLYASMGMQSETYPRIIAILRDLVGGGVMQLPSSAADLTSELTASDMETYVRSPGVAAVDRIKLFKLAWDVVGSEFGGRHQQYEMFYAGAPFVVKTAYAFRHFDFDGAIRDVEEFMSAYKLERMGEPARG